MTGRQKYYFLFLLLIFSVLGPFSAYAIEDAIYDRNGEVYVMIGRYGDNQRNPFMGVWSSSKVNDDGTLDSTDVPGGVKLFPKATGNASEDEKNLNAMDDYYAIAADQFRNIYVLSAKIDPTFEKPKAGDYSEIDPPLNEGIVGIGADGAGNAYYDVINYAPGKLTTWHGNFGWPRFKGIGVFYDEANIGTATGAIASAGTPDAPPPNVLADYKKKYDNAAIATMAGSAPVPYNNFGASKPFLFDITFLDGSKVTDVIPGVPASPWVCCGYFNGWGVATHNTTPLKIFNAFDPDQVKRIGKNSKGQGDVECWYPGYYPRWYMHADGGRYNPGCSARQAQGLANWQRRSSITMQKINLWITNYIHAIPKTVPQNGTPLPQTKKEYPFEQVFKTTNLKYLLDRESICGESHPDACSNVPVEYSKNQFQSLSVTGAGRRYSYSSLPKPTIKKGSVDFGFSAGSINYGVPLPNSSSIFQSNGQGNDNPPGIGTIINKNLTFNTVGVGAATRTDKTDWVYAAPESDPDGKIVDFSVADQWDGNGGILYRLIEPPAKNKKILKWDKYKEYAVDTSADEKKLKHGVLDLKSDVKCIAADGRGTLYWLTDAREQPDMPRLNAKYFDCTVTPEAPIVMFPPKPVAYTDNSNKVRYKWKVKCNVPAACELWCYDYYSGKVGDKPKNSFVVGFEDVEITEVFSDAAGKDRISVQTQVMGTPIKDVRLDLATINLAGPPKGSKENNCVDIVSKEPAITGIAGIKITDGNGKATLLEASSVDEITEDSEYSAKMENAPTKKSFSEDYVCVNTLSGDINLKDENGNGIKGGFRYSLRPGTTAYYWKLEMVEPVKKVMTNLVTFPTKKVSGFPDWPPKDYTGKAMPNVPALNAGEWVVSEASGEPANPMANWTEADPNFSFKPSEPGIYKISLMSTAKFYRYENMPYPSYITQRDLKEFKPSEVSYLFFDNGAGGGGINDAKMAGDETVVSYRYLAVTAKPSVADDYVTKISVTGPAGEIEENKVYTFEANATLKYVKSFRHDEVSEKMETFNGIGCFDYPTGVSNLWGLMPYDKGERYDLAAALSPTNIQLDAKGNPSVNENLRNYGEAPKGVAGVGSPLVYKTGDSKLWIEGVGTQTDPEKPLNRADRGAITYEWYLAAENTNTTPSTFIGWDQKSREPDILIAKGRLSDEKTFDGTNIPAVEWNTHTSNTPGSARLFNVKVRLRYAFEMPLKPGRYFLYIKFNYPKVKWAGRSEKDKGGKTGLFAHYDLVDDGSSSTSYNTVNWTSLNASTSEPAGLPIVVRDGQSPQGFFDAGAFASAGNPAPGFGFKGGTTADPFPTEISYVVCDNNPNDKKVEATLRAMVGTTAKSLAWKSVSGSKISDEAVDFGKPKVETILKQTITPFKAWGTLQQPAKINAISNYPGYGADAPFRKLVFKHAAYTTISGSEVPYDMVGSLPLNIEGKDGENNKIGDFNCDGTVGNNEVVLTPVDDSPNKKDYTASPGYYEIIDNDPPSVTFRIMDPRQGNIREYAITNDVPKSYTDKLSWMNATQKLIYDDYGKQYMKASQLDLNNQFKEAIMASRLSTENGNEFKIYKYNLLGPVLIGEDKIITKPASGLAYTINYGGKKVQFANAYQDYSPSKMFLYDFNAAMDSKNIIEIAEDVRTKFEVLMSDNVEGVIAPGSGNCFIQAENMGKQEEVDKIFEGLKSVSTPEKKYFTYFIIREPSSTGISFVLTACKDTAGNTTAIKIPINVLNTHMIRTTINVESKRSE